jgi:hypothetical protein
MIDVELPSNLTVLNKPLLKVGDSLLSPFLVAKCLQAFARSCTALGSPERVIMRQMVPLMQSLPQYVSSVVQPEGGEVPILYGSPHLRSILETFQNLLDTTTLNLSYLQIPIESDTPFVDATLCAHILAVEGGRGQLVKILVLGSKLRNTSG